MARRRGKVKRDSQTLLSRDWDKDEFDPYSIAVSTVLESMEGLWFESDDTKLEKEVNDHVQTIKRKIQEML